MGVLFVLTHRVEEEGGLGRFGGRSRSAEDRGEGGE